MNRSESMTVDFQKIISQYSFEDFKEGIPYVKARELCDTYTDYQDLCNLIDAEGVERGIDPLVLSGLHSVFERLYFKNMVYSNRLGMSSKRLFANLDNAAPGYLDDFTLSDGESSVYILASRYKIENEKVYCYIKGAWTVISHTVLRPVSIIYNVEQQSERIIIMYKWHEQFHTFECLPSEINNVKFIKKLVDRGIYIVVDCAELVCDFLETAIRLNRGGTIEEIRVTDSLGWIEVNNRMEFVPFSNMLVYSGEHVHQSFAGTFIEPHGSLEEWIELIKQFRDKDHIHARMILAASFASVLVKPLEALPFAVDVWGGGSGSGKSVSLMTATSVWAKPGIDDGYIKKFDSTTRSLEADAAILNNFPLCIEEKQTVSDRKKFDSLIYNLCSGESHGAMVAGGGKKREEKHWSNTIIFTGEQPIVTESSLAGASNRVIDIECPNALFWDDKTKFPEYCKRLRENYGTAGRKFIDHLCWRNGIEHARELYTSFLNVLQTYATGKQAANAALILTADSLVAEWIFKDDLKLSVDDIIPFLKDEKAVDTNERAHQLVLEWIATNSGKFEDGRDIQWGRYGTRNGRRTCEIVRKPFNEFLTRNGFSDRSYLSWAKNAGKIYYKEGDPNGRNDVVGRFNGEYVRFVCIYIDGVE